MEIISNNKFKYSLHVQEWKIFTNYKLGDFANIAEIILSNTT